MSKQFLRNFCVLCFALLMTSKALASLQGVWEGPIQFTNEDGQEETCQLLLALSENEKHLNVFNKISCHNEVDGGLLIYDLKLSDQNLLDHYGTTVGNYSPQLLDFSNAAVEISCSGIFYVTAKFEAVDDGFLQVNHLALGIQPDGTEKKVSWTGRLRIK